MKTLFAVSIVALAASFSAGAVGLTDAQLGSWDILITGALSGGEKLTTRANGISSTGGFSFQSIKLQSDYTMTFGANGLIDTYTATITAAGKSASFVGATNGQTLTLKVSQNGNLLAQKDFTLTASTVLLDNNIASQYRFLSRLLDPTTPGKTALQLLVPSSLALISVTASPSAGVWAWNAGAAAGTALRWDIGSPAVPTISVYQDTASRQILGVDIAAAGAQYRLTGLTLTSNAQASAVPPIFDPTAVKEKTLTVTTGSFTMGATLSYPGAGSGPFPGVLLVAGSGPNDRDETIGPNKPFRDIAIALTHKGFAVLRFDKRTFAYRGNALDLNVSSMTVKEEFIDDSVSALRLLAAQPNVDGRRLTIIGHSLGGWGLPFIVEGLGPDASRLRHLVYLAPGGRDWKPMILHQLRFQASLVPDNLAAKNAVADAEKRFADYTATGTMSGPFLSASALYWNDLLKRDPVALASKIAVDSLFVHGSRDIQIDDADFLSWQSVLGGVAGRQFVTLPDLNHLFMHTDGPSTGAEYFTEGHVSIDVIDLIANQLAR
jgi:predicted alpha/beta-hydrolase family hydrolase